MKFYYLLGILFAWAIWTPALAQGSAPATSVESPITLGQRQAAELLLNTIYSESSFNQVIDQRLATQFKIVPGLKAYEKELRDFISKYLSWSSLKPDMVDTYAREFTEAELREITRYYQSPIGQKALSKLPALRQRSLDTGQRRLQEHLPEFQEMLAKKAAGTED